MFRLIIIMAVSISILGCGAAKSLYTTQETDAEREARLKYEGLIAGLSETCGVDLERMDVIVSVMHADIIANRVGDFRVETAEAYRMAVRGALHAQREHGYTEPGPRATCEQVAKDYTFIRPRDWHKRRQTPWYSARYVVRMISWEAQGWTVRRIY